MHRVRRLSKRLASLPHCHRGGTLLLWTTVFAIRHHTRDVPKANSSTYSHSPFRTLHQAYNCCSSVHSFYKTICPCARTHSTKHPFTHATRKNRQSHPPPNVTSTDIYRTNILISPVLFSSYACSCTSTEGNIQFNNCAQRDFG